MSVLQEYYRRMLPSGWAIPNKAELLQAVVFGAPRISNDSSYREFVDKIGKVNTTPQEWKGYQTNADWDYVAFDVDDFDNEWKVTFRYKYSNFVEQAGLIWIADWDNKRWDIYPYNDGSWLRVFIWVDGGNSAYWRAIYTFTEGEYYDIEMQYNWYDTAPTLTINWDEYVVESPLTSGAATISDKLQFFAYWSTLGSWTTWKHAISNFKMYDRDDNLIHAYHCDEWEWAISYDSVWGVNWTIVNADLSTFHTTDNNFESYQNTVWYSEDVTDGVELIDNGWFDTDTDWNKGTGWTISDGKARCDNTSANNLYQTWTIESWKRYKLDFTVSDYVSGSLTAGIGWGSFPNDTLTVYADWDYSFIGTAVNTYLLFRSATSGFVGSLDNVSLEEAPVWHIPVELDSEWKSTHLDVLGNTPTYDWQLKYNIKIVWNNVGLFDWVNDKLTFSDLSGITITSSTWTATPTISWNDITCTAGYLNSLVLSNGSTYSFAEGNWTTIYDRAWIMDWEVSTADIDTFRSTVDAVKPHNIIDWFDLWTNDSDSSLLRVPFDTDWDSIKTDWDTVTWYTWTSINPAGKFHNNAESLLEQYKVPELYTNDLDMKYWYEVGSDTPERISYDDIVSDVFLLDPRHKVFADTSVSDLWEWFEKKKIITYNEEQTGDDLDKIYKVIKDSVVRDEDNEPLLDEDSNVLYG